MNVTNALEFTNYVTHDGIRYREITVALLPYRVSPDEEIVDTNPTQHLFKRGPDDGVCGDGSLFHVRSRNSYPSVVIDDQLNDQLRAFYENSEKTPILKITSLIGGATPWMPVYSEEHAFVFYTNGVCHLRHYGRNLQVTWYEDLIYNGRRGRMSRMAASFYTNPGYYDPDPLVTFNLVWYSHSSVSPEEGYWTRVLSETVWSPSKPVSINDLGWCDSLGQLYESCTQVGYFEDHNLARAAATAYQAAVNSLPEASTNTIQNIIECVKFLTSPLKSVPKTVGDAWLAYRYAFTTTKLDLAEYAAYASRLDALLQSCKKEVACFGEYRYKEYNIKCCCYFRISDILPSDFCGWLQSIGVKINLYNLWDMVPLSFVVDWFLHIGDILRVFEDYGESLSLTPTGVWYSFYTSRNQGGSYQDVYVRLRGSGKNKTMPFYTYKEVSGKTMLMRVTDSYSLLLG